MGLKWLDSHAGYRKPLPAVWLLFNLVGSSELKPPLRLTRPADKHGLPQDAKPRRSLTFMSRVWSAHNAVMRAPRVGFRAGGGVVQRPPAAPTPSLRGRDPPFLRPQHKEFGLHDFEGPFQP